MKKFIVSVIWMVLAFPFYVLILASVAYSKYVFGSIGRIFNKTEPYEWLDDLDGKIYDVVKKEFYNDENK